MPSSYHPRANEDLTDQAEQLRQRLFRVTAAIRRHENTGSPIGGLTLTQCSLLDILREKRRARISDLAARQRLNLTTVGRAVTRLRDLGMVKRTRDLSDHRNIWVEITPKGVLAQRAAVTSLMGPMLDHMTFAEIATLDAALAPVEQSYRSFATD